MNVNRYYFYAKAKDGRVKQYYRAYTLRKNDERDFILKFIVQ